MIYTISRWIFDDGVAKSPIYCVAPQGHFLRGIYRTFCLAIWELRHDFLRELLDGCYIFSFAIICGNLVLIDLVKS